MRKIAVIEPKEREALFRNTSAKMGVSEAVIEKDFMMSINNSIRHHRNHEPLSSMLPFSPLRIPDGLPQHKSGTGAASKEKAFLYPVPRKENIQLSASSAK